MSTVVLRRVVRPICPARAVLTSDRAPWFSTRARSTGATRESAITTPSGRMSVTRAPAAAAARVTQIEPGEEDAHGDERDERERELDRDAPSNEADHEVSPSVSSKR